MEKMTRAEVLRKCLIVFDALRRVSSKGNAGLEALQGAEESFQTDSEICRVLREWLQEMEAGAKVFNARKLTKEEYEEIEGKILGGGSYLKPCGPKPETDMPLATDALEYMLQGNPLMTEETIEAARRLDKAQERLIEKYASQGLAVPKGPLDQRAEPNVPKVGELEDYENVTRIADWQREVMEHGVPEELRLT